MASNLVTPLGTGVTVPLPDVFGGFLVNDIVFVFVYAMWNADFGSSSLIEPTSLEWTQIGQEEIDYSLVQAGMGDRLGAWYFPVTVDGVGPSDLEFTWAFPAAFAARAIVYRNVNAADPFFNQPMQVGLPGDPALVDVSVATLVPNTRVLVAMAARSGQNDTAFNINDDSLGNPKFNRRSQGLTNDQTSPQGGGFPAFGSYPDQGSPDLANGDYGSLSLSDRVYSLAATPIISGQITAGPVTGLSTQAMGLAIRLNEAA